MNRVRPLGRLLLVLVALLWVTQPAIALPDSSLDESLVSERGYSDASSPIDCYEDSVERPDQPGTMPPSDSNGRNTSYFRFMWSEDPDYQNITAENRSDTNDTELAAIEACRGDRTYDQPPETTRWNALEHQSYPTGESDSWAAPAYVELSSGGSGAINVNDAYVAIFATTPSTVIHTRNGTTRYAAPNGTVRAIIDYRIPEPRDSEFGNTEIRRFLGNYSTSTVLYVDGEAVDNTSAAHPELAYTGLSGTSDLTVETTITVNVTEIQITEIKEVNNGSVEFNENRTVTFQEYDHTISSETRTVTVQDLEGMSIDGGVGWDNRTGAIRQNESVLGVSIPGMWQELDFAAGYGVHSQWEFYTRGNESWTTWNGTSTDSETAIRPLEVHAVPVSAGPVLTTSRLGAQEDNSHFVPSLEVAYPTTSMAPPPSVSESVTIDQAGNTTTAERFTIRSEESLAGTGEFTLYGVVRGRSVTRSLNVGEPAPIRPANISVEVFNAESSPVDVQISVNDTTGQPVNSGQLVVSTGESRAVRQLTSETNGVVTVSLSQSGLDSVDVRYQPSTPFWDQSRAEPLRETAVIRYHVREFPEFTEWIDFAVVTLLWLTPLGLLLYGMDVLANGKLLHWYDP
jgi:hypothetical protein